MLELDVNSSRVLRATVLKLQTLDKETASQIRDQTRATVLPIWTESLRGNSETRQEVILADSGRIKFGGNQTITLQAGGVMGGRTLDLRKVSRAIEFGADQNKVSHYIRHRNGYKPHAVSRHVQTGFKRPRRNGYVVYPAFSREAMGRMASLWVQTVVRATHEAFEGGQ